MAKVHIKFKDQAVCGARATKNKLRFAAREKFLDIPEDQQCKNCRRVVAK